MTPPSESLVKRRFFALNSFRVVGALMVMLGFALIAGAFPIAGQPDDRWLGIGFVLLGVFDFAIMPLILARRWRTPRA